MRQQNERRWRYGGQLPVGWIDNGPVVTLDHDIIGPIHNAMTPVKEMVAAGLTVAIGNDNMSGHTQTIRRWRHVDRTSLPPRSPAHVRPRYFS